jgi:hypothetical protein
MYLLLCSIRLLGFRLYPLKYTSEYRMSNTPKGVRSVFRKLLVAVSSVFSVRIDEDELRGYIVNATGLRQEAVDAVIDAEMDYLEQRKVAVR